MTKTSAGRARWRPAARGEGALGQDPFALLGLPTRPGLCDDDVQAAWRRIAAATHPDREDGGDPARFGAAAAAYAMLRTGFGRGEALADLGLSGTADHHGRHAHRRGRSAEPAGGAGRHRARRGRSRTRSDAPIRGAGDAAAAGPADAGRQAWTVTTPRSPWPPPPGRPGQPGSPGRRPRRARPRLAGWRARWPTAQWASTVRSAGRPLQLRPMRRPGGLALLVAGAAAVGVVAVVISGWSPGVVGVLVGVLTWLLATAGHAFARRRP